MYKEISANKRKTVLMMLIFVMIVAGFGWIFGKFVGSESILPYVLLGSLAYIFISYMSGSKVALALNGAKQIAKQDNPRLWRTVENLSITTGLPMPKVYIINDPAPNAFATGRDPNHSVVCVTNGLLDIMNDTELEGVLAHELGHIGNYDIRVSLIAFGLVGIISILADIILRLTWFSGDDDNNNSIFFVIGIVAAIVTPIIATLIQLSISRRREYLADATGALTTRYPEGLASALEKISQAGSTMKRQNTSTAHLFFANPMRKKTITNLFSTHPPIAERVKKLREIGRSA